MVPPCFRQRCPSGMDRSPPLPPASARPRSPDDEPVPPDLLVLDAPAAARLRVLLSTRGYRPEFTDGVPDYMRWVPSVPSTHADRPPVLTALDPLAAALFADLPGTATITPEQFAGSDPRQRFVRSTARGSWVPGQAGFPGELRGAVATVGGPDGIEPLIAVDTARCEPRVLDHTDEPEFVELRTLPAAAPPPPATRLRILGGEPGVWGADAGRVRGELDQADLVVALRAGFRSSLERALVVLVAAARGIPCLVDDAGSLRPYVDGELLDILGRADAARLATDAFYRDITGVWLRRRALAAHSEQATWRRLRRGFGLPNPPEPTVSVLVSTIRPHYMPAVIGYLNAQTYRNSEVLVTVDRQDVTAGQRSDWQAMAQFDLHVVQNHDEVPVGELYNEALGRADGEIAVIWDDDDHYGRHHLLDLVLGLRHTSGTIVGKGAEFFHLQSLDLTVQRWHKGRYTDTTWIGGSNLAFQRSEILELGGFPPVSAGYDQRLIERVRAAGKRAYRLPGYEYVATRRASGHTWNPGDGYFLELSARQWPGMALDAAGFDALDDVPPTRRYR